MQKSFEILANKIAKKAGKTFEQILIEVDNTSIATLQGELDHYYNEYILNNIPLIRRYSFNTQTPSDVIGEFHQLEDAYKLKHEDEGIDPKKLITPDQMKEDDAKKIMEFPDGWVWWILPINYSEAEARSGDNCGTCEMEDSELLSLRRPIKVGEETWWKSELTAELTDEGMIRQLRHGNDKPDAKYNPYIMKLLVEYESINGFELPDYKPNDTFFVKDLPYEDQKELEEVNSNLVVEPGVTTRTNFEVYDELVSESDVLDVDTWSEAVEEVRNYWLNIESDILVRYNVLLNEVTWQGDDADYGDSEVVSEVIGKEQDEPLCKDGKTHEWVKNELSNNLTEVDVNIGGEEVYITCYDADICKNCGIWRAGVNEDSKMYKDYGNHRYEVPERIIYIYEQVVYQESTVAIEEWVAELEEGGGTL